MMASPWHLTATREPEGSGKAVALGELALP
jgi:hypothetical protein